MADPEKKVKGADAEPEKEKVAPTKPIERIEHSNIFVALAAFQGENPTIKRTKEFGKEGEKMHWWYTPLDEVLQTVRPLTAKHGLAFTWEGVDGQMVCALYHTTYSKKYTVIKSAETDQTITYVPAVEEENVIRSMPIKVKREGDMKEIGGNSTYVRRYTLAEVLGIAPDEDNDIGEEAARTEKLEGFAFSKARENVQKADTLEKLTENAKFVEKDLKSIADGKTPSLGLKKEQYEELQQLIAKRRVEIEKALKGTGAPGDNKDGGGQAALIEGDK